jgi:CBS domain-containing protein
VYAPNPTIARPNTASRAWTSTVRLSTAAHSDIAPIPAKIPPQARAMSSLKLTTAHPFSRNLFPTAPTDSDRLPAPDRSNMTTAADVMTTDTKTVRPNTEIGTVLTKLARAEFDGFPVVDEEYRVVGIVTQSDLIHVFQPSDRVVYVPIGFPPFSDVVDYAFDLSWDELDVGIDLVKTAGKPVKTVMTEAVVTVSPDADFDEVLAILANPDRDINRVPVVDGDGRLEGIVARQDLLRALAAERGVSAGIGEGSNGPE